MTSKQPRKQPKVKLSHCAWWFQDPVYKWHFWVGGFAKNPTISLQLSPDRGTRHLWTVSTGPAIPWQLGKASEVCWTRQFPFQGTPCVYTIGAHFLLLAFVWAVSFDMGCILVSFTAISSRYTTQLEARATTIALTPNLTVSAWPSLLFYFMWSITHPGSVQTVTHTCACICMGVSICECVSMHLWLILMHISDFLIGCQSFCFASFP